MNDSLRIAIALPGLHRVIRGAETALEQLARELSRLGHRVTLFGSGARPEGEPYQYQQIPCTPREAFENWPRLPAVRSHYGWEELSFAQTLLRKYRPEDFDISIACSYPFMNWILRRGGPHGRPKHVFVTQNGDWMLQANHAEYHYFNCDALVCTNPQYFEKHRGRFPSAMIPNGVDTARFSPGPRNRAAFGLPEDRRIALMVSALIPSKRVSEGIAAAAKAPDLFLAIAGDGECRREIEREARRLMPGRFKRLSLPREQMPDLYRCADAFLHVSREEPSANVYLEALACGLPIVTHDSPVTRWTLGNSSFLVDAENSAAVTDALVKALDAKGEKEISIRREQARKFEWSAIGEQYSGFLRGLFAPFPKITPPPREGVLADVAVVAIGRNEGERLTRCLASIKGKVSAIVYVDSGSSDGSPRVATSMGATVVYLDSRQPFTAARARNAGLEKLEQIAPKARYVQFVDGDCEVQEGWLETARAYLQSSDGVAAVCGRRRELRADRSIFNRIIDLEWDTPIGPAKSCGGDAMMKIAAVRQVGSFNATVMAGEEPELCLRLRNAGYRVWRIDAEMTRHDSAIRRYKQMWLRQIRGGYGAIDVFTRFGQHDRLFASQVHSAQIWGLVVPFMIPIAFMLGCFFGPLTDMDSLSTGLLLALLVIALWAAQWGKLTLSSLRKGRPLELSVAWAWYTMLGKFAAIVGQRRWRQDYNSGQKAALIEYKPQRLSMVVVSKEVKA